MWGKEADREGWGKDTWEKRLSTLKYYHFFNNKNRNIWLLTLHTVAGRQNTHISANTQMCMYKHAQKIIKFKKKKIRCHLASETQLITEAARKQCWGARSDRANRKQAAFCIPGQSAQHNTDTGRDTETDHLWPKTIHLPCSPRWAELRWKGFFVLPVIPVFCGKWKLLLKTREGQWGAATEVVMLCYCTFKCYTVHNTCEPFF